MHYVRSTLSPYHTFHTGTNNVYLHNDPQAPAKVTKKTEKVFLHHKFANPENIFDNITLCYTYLRFNMHYVRNTPSTYYTSHTNVTYNIYDT